MHSNAIIVFFYCVIKMTSASNNSARFTTLLPTPSKTTRTLMPKLSKLMTQQTTSTVSTNQTNKANTTNSTPKDNKEAKRASLIVAAGIIPGTVLLFVLCLTIPRCCAARQKRKQKKEMDKPTKMQTYKNPSLNDNKNS